MKRLLTIDKERLQNVELGQQTVDHRLQTTDYRPQTSCCGGQGLLLRLALLLCLVTGGVNGAWADTEDNPISNINDNTDIKGTSYSLKGDPYVAGNQAKVGNMTRQAIKLRLTKNNNTTPFIVDKDYVITRISFDLAAKSNDSNKNGSFKISQVDVDDSKLTDSSGNTKTWNVTGNETDKTSTNVDITGINALKSIVLHYSDLVKVNASQAAATWTVTYQKKSVTLSQSSGTMYVGETLNLSSIITTNYSNNSIAYQSGNTAVATVSASGVVYALSTGTAKITATVTDASGYKKELTYTLNVSERVITGKKWNFENNSAYTVDLSTLASSSLWTTDKSVSSVGTVGKYYWNGTGTGFVLYSTGTNKLLTPDGLTFTRANNSDGRIISVTPNKYLILAYSTLNITNVSTSQKVKIKFVNTGGNSSGAPRGKVSVTNATCDTDNSTWSNHEVPNTATTYTFTPTSNGTVSIDNTNSYTIGVQSIEIVSDSKVLPTATLSYPSVNVGGTATATLICLDDGKNVLDKYNISYISSDEAVATVNSTSGVVTGVAIGTATISVVLTPKSGNESSYYPVVAQARVNVLNPNFEWTPSAVEVNVADLNDNNQPTGGLPELNLGGKTVTALYSSSNPDVANFFNNDNFLRIKGKRGEAIITATANDNSTATYTLNVTGTDNVAPTLNASTNTLTYGTPGFAAAKTISLDGLDIAIGSGTENVVVVSNGGSPAVKVIAGNGFSHPHVTSNVPDMGTFFKLTPSLSGTLKLTGVFNSTLRLYESGTPSSPLAADATEVSLSLTAGKTYYLYHTDAALKVHSFQYTLTTEDKDIEFKYFEWLKNNNANTTRKSLDRRIPNWDVEFAGGNLKYAHNATNGNLSFQSDGTGETITITPRLKEGAAASDIRIVGVTLTASGTSGTPKLKAYDGTSEAETSAIETHVANGTVYLPVSGSGQKVVIKRTSSGTQNFDVNKITVHYVILNGKTTAEVLDDTKIAPALSFAPASHSLVEVGAEGISTLTIQNPNPRLDGNTNRFGGTIVITQTDDGTGISLTTSSDPITDSGNNYQTYTVTAKVLQTASSTVITAAYAGNIYFATAEATFTVSPGDVYWSASSFDYPFTSILPTGLPILTNKLVGGTITYSSGDTDVADFLNKSDYGSLRIKAVGTTTITATHTDGEGNKTEAQYTLNVTAASGGSWDFVATFTETRNANNFGSAFWKNFDTKDSGGRNVYQETNKAAIAGNTKLALLNGSGGDMFPGLLIDSYLGIAAERLVLSNNGARGLWNGGSGEFRVIVTEPYAPKGSIIKVKFATLSGSGASATAACLSGGKYLTYEGGNVYTYEVTDNDGIVFRVNNNYRLSSISVITLGPRDFLWETTTPKASTLPLFDIDTENKPTGKTYAVVKLLRNVDMNATVTFESSNTDVAVFANPNEETSLRLRGVDKTTITATMTTGGQTFTDSYELTVTGTVLTAESSYGNYDSETNSFSFTANGQLTGVTEISSVEGITMTMDNPDAGNTYVILPDGAGGNSLETSVKAISANGSSQTVLSGSTPVGGTYYKFVTTARNHLIIEGTLNANTKLTDASGADIPFLKHGDTKLTTRTELAPGTYYAYNTGDDVLFLRSFSYGQATSISTGTLFTYRGFAMNVGNIRVMDGENDVTDQFILTFANAAGTDAYYSCSADGSVLTGKQPTLNPVAVQIIATPHRASSGYKPVKGTAYLRVFNYEVDGEGSSQVWNFSGLSEYDVNLADFTDLSDFVNDDALKGLEGKGHFHIYANRLYFDGVNTSLRIPVMNDQQVYVWISNEQGYNKNRAIRAENALSETGLGFENMWVAQVTNNDRNDINKYTKVPLIASSDGYVTLKDYPYSTQFNVKRIEVTKVPLFFADGDEVHVATSTPTYTNSVSNPNGATISYAVKTDASSIVKDLNASTGTFSDGAGGEGNGFKGDGTVVVTATAVYPEGHAPLTRITTGSYELHVRNLHFEHPHLDLALGGYNTDTYRKTSVWYKGHSQNNNGLKEPNGSDYSDDVVPEYYYIIKSGSPTVNINAIDDNPADPYGYQLLIKGVGTIEVHARISHLDVSYTVTTTGQDFKLGGAPAVPYGTTSFTNAIDDPNFNYEVVRWSKGIGSEPTIDPSTGKLTIPEGAEGVIEVKATHKTVSDQTLSYVLTVQYKDAYTTKGKWWYFQNHTTPGADSDKENGVWHMHRYDKNAANNCGTELSVAEMRSATDFVWTPRVHSTADKSTWRYIMAYQKTLSGDNGFHFPETIGLQIICDKGFGISTSSDNAWDESKSDQDLSKLSDSERQDNQFIGLRTGSTFVVPALKAGQWIDIYWKRHVDTDGDRLTCENVCDIRATRDNKDDYVIDRTLLIGRANEASDGHLNGGPYTFRVKEDGDARFTVVGTGWTDVLRVHVYGQLGDDGTAWDEPYQPTMRNLQQPKAEDTPTTISTAKDVSILYDEENRSEKLESGYTLDKIVYTYANQLYSPVAKSIPRLETTKNLKATLSTGLFTSTGGGDYSYPKVSITDGYGKFYLTYDIFSEDLRYVVGTKTFAITVGHAPHQSYPYTWDFTNISGGKVEGQTNNVFNSIKADETNWTANGNKFTLKVDDDSYYVPGSTLVSTDRDLGEDGEQAYLTAHDFAVDEFNGLGFKGQITIQTNTKEASSPGARRKAPSSTAYAPLVCEEDVTITIPDVTSDFRIYVCATKKDGSTPYIPTVDAAEAVQVTSGDDYDANANVTQYEVTRTAKGAVKLKFLAGARIYKIGVTDIFKKNYNHEGTEVAGGGMTQVADKGWATESRAQAIDHSLTGYFTKHDVNAYVVTGEEKPYNRDYIVAKREEVDIVPAGVGVVLHEANDPGVGDNQHYEVPFFVPSATAVIPDPAADAPFTANLLRPTAGSDPSTDSRSIEFDSETETDGGVSYTRFILSQYFYQWSQNSDQALETQSHPSKEWTTPDDDDSNASGNGRRTGKAAFYRMHIFTNTEKADEGFSSADADRLKMLNTITRNKAYLLVSTALNDAMWTEENNYVAPSPSRGSTRGYVFFDDEGLETIGDEPRQGEEAPERLSLEEAVAAGQVYNLQGQQVSNLKSGQIYIYRGKKVLK